MCAAEDNGVNLGVKRHYLVDAFFHKVVGSWRVSFIVFNQGYPERTCHARYLDVGMEFLNFKVIAFTLDGSLGGQHTHMTTMGEVADDFGGWADDAQHASFGIPLRQVVLLNGAQSLG